MWRATLLGTDSKVLPGPTRGGGALFFFLPRGPADLDIVLSCTFLTDTGLSDGKDFDFSIWKQITKVIVFFYDIEKLIWISTCTDSSQDCVDNITHFPYHAHCSVKKMNQNCLLWKTKRFHFLIIVYHFFLTLLL